MSELEATSEVIEVPKVEISLTSEDIVDEGGAPVSRGDEGILEGVAIGDNFDEGNSSGSDDDETGIVIHAGRATSRRPIYKSFGLKSQRNQSSLLKDVSGAAQKVGEEDELKKLRFIRHVTAFDVDINTLDEHPWRNKNVDLLDYFNYGFGENTWMEYCARQLRIRAGKGLGPHQPVIKAVVPPSVVVPVVPPVVVVNQIPVQSAVNAATTPTMTQSIGVQSTSAQRPLAATPQHHQPVEGLSAFHHPTPSAHLNPVAATAGFPVPLTEPGWAHANVGQPLPVPHHHMHMSGAPPPHFFPGQNADMWGREFHHQQSSVAFDGAHQHNFQHQQFHQQAPNQYGGASERQYPPVSARPESERTAAKSYPSSSSSKREASPPRSQSRRDREDSGRAERDRGGTSEDHKKSESSSKRSRDSDGRGDRDRGTSDSRRDEPRDSRDSSRGQKDRSEVTLSGSSTSSSKRRQTESRSRSRERKHSRVTEERRRK